MSWLHRTTQTLVSAGVEGVDQLLVKLDTLREEGKRASPEEFWRPEQQRVAQKRVKAYIHIGVLASYQVKP